MISFESGMSIKLTPVVVGVAQWNIMSRQDGVFYSETTADALFCFCAPFPVPSRLFCAEFAAEEFRSQRKQRKRRRTARSLGVI